jgi:hypothetical protein
MSDANDAECLPGPDRAEVLAWAKRELARLRELLVLEQQSEPLTKVQWARRLELIHTIRPPAQPRKAAKSLRVSTKTPRKKPC